MNPSDDQEGYLDNASTIVKEQAYYMKKALDQGQLRDALKHASNMLCGLRTNMLSPKNYFMLCKLPLTNRYERV
jgi:vacuolar protein sorting-associated protein 35